MAILCPSCGEENLNVYKFCTACGRDLTSNFCTKKECENSISGVKADAKYCPMCGSHTTLWLQKNQETEQALEWQQEEIDAHLEEYVLLAIDAGQVSASMLQRRFRIGYARAGRIIDRMEQLGIVSGFNGSVPRSVLIDKSEWDSKKIILLPPAPL